MVQTQKVNLGVITVLLLGEAMPLGETLEREENQEVERSAW